MLDEGYASERLGGLLVRKQAWDEARACLERAMELARPGPMTVLRATAGVWLDLLPEGNVQRARIALERDAEIIAARTRLRLHCELAKRTRLEADAQAATELAGALLASVPDEVATRMRERVLLFRDALT